MADARAKLGGAQGPNSKAVANGELNTALSRLMVIVENYPNLKADKNFRALMDELSRTENYIAVARKDYNESVQLYNTTIRSLPASLFAKLYSFDSIEYFKADEGAKQAPQVKF